MSKIVSTGKKRPKKAPISWDDAIRYAEEQIEQARRRITVLEGTVGLFRARQRAGDSFPGTAPIGEQATIRR